MIKIVGAPTLQDALEVLASEISAREARGERNLIFCEDRLTLLAEHAVLRGQAGSILTEVTTFARFLAGGRKVLSKQGSVMAISAILSAREEEGCFSRSAAPAVYDTIAQLAASRVRPEDLRAAAEETEGLLGAKLRDLAQLSQAYSDFLTQEGFLDESGYLALLPQAIEALAGEWNVFFFAFPSFTAQAREGVRAAISKAKDVVGIFLAGKQEIYTNEGARLFRSVASEMGEAQVTMAPCTLDGEAKYLLERIFSPAAYAQPPRPAKGVHFFCTADEWEEYDRVAALIRMHVGQGLRYRDIAVLVPSEESFSAVEKAFSAYHVPFYADKKRKFSTHPFCDYALCVLEAVAGGLLPADVDAICANVCFGEGDAYRNYLLKFAAYRGGARREIKEGDAVTGYDRAALLSARERLLSALRLFPKTATGRQYADGVRALLQSVKWENIERSLSAYCTAEEARFLSIEPLEGVLQEICAVAGGRTFPVREFATFLRSGLETLERSMVPQAQDVVFVGDATESRLLRFPVVFATGLTDALPRVSQDTAVITDREIGRLKEIRVQIEPAIAEVNARARENLALNLCSFTQRLYLSRPLKLHGEETSAGEVTEYVLHVYDAAPMPEVFPYNCCEYAPAFFNLVALKEDFERGLEEDGGRYSALAAALIALGEEERVKKLTGTGEKDRVPAAKELYFARGTISPTLLEGYFKCPYASFATSALRLREREEGMVRHTDTGNFIHTVLEEVAKRADELHDEGACRDFARTVATELLDRPVFRALRDTDAGKYTASRLLSESAVVAVAAWRQLKGSAFHVRNAEGQIALPELNIAGKADRIDESDDYVRVIDYKSGSYDLSAGVYYTGRRLQLQLYLLAASKGGRPAGAFYFPAADNFSKVDEEKWRLEGFYNDDRDVINRMDTALKEGEESTLFKGKLAAGGKKSEQGMNAEDFAAFLDYAVLVSAGAKREMEAGYVAPRPFSGECSYCNFKGMCAFSGEVRKERAIKCSEIVSIVKRRREE